MEDTVAQENGKNREKQNKKRDNTQFEIQSADRLDGSVSITTSSCCRKMESSMESLKTAISKKLKEGEEEERKNRKLLGFLHDPVDCCSRIRSDQS